MTDYLRIAEFVQVQVMAGKSNAAATAGACHNFSIHWCALMYRDSRPESAATRMTKLSVSKGEANLVLQKTYVDAFSEQGRNWESADNLGVAIRGLARIDYVIPYGNFDQKTVVDIIRKPPAEALVYTFSFPGGIAGAQGGTHTIAFFRKLRGRRGVMEPESGVVSAYDPNFGEYAIPEMEFNYWFNKLKATYNGKFTTHRMMRLKDMSK
ncbi:MAG: hypothetical protein ACTHJY_04460 [Rhizobiaceae bacterium]